MLMVMKVGDVAKLENMDSPATDGHYKLTAFHPHVDRSLEIEWTNVESNQIVRIPLAEIEDHMQYMIPMTPVRYVKIRP